MIQLLQLTAIEIKLYLRSKMFWILAALILASAIFASFDLLLIQFIVVSAATRDKRAGISEIIKSLPYASAKILLSRALAVFVLLLGLWPFMIIIICALLQISLFEWLFNFKQLAFYALNYMTACVTSISFVFFVSLVTRHPWRLYLIIGACWVVEVLFASNLAYFPSWSQLFLLGHGIMLPKAPPENAGYFLQYDLLTSCAIFQTAVAVLLLVFTAVRQMVKRGEYVLKSKLLPTLGLLAITAAAAAGFAVWQDFACREGAFQSELHKADILPVASTQKTLGSTPVLTDYQLAVKLQTASHRLAGIAKMNLKLTASSSDIVYFTLRNCFTVESISDNSGQKLEWWRDGSRLAVRIPAHSRQAALPITITYSGQVWEWFAGLSSRPNGPVIFVDSAFSLLRSGFAWYPVPGDYPLYVRKYFVPHKVWPNSTLWENRVTHPAVPFELTVDIDSDSTVASNLEQTGVETLTGEYKKRYHFSALQGRDVFLLTGLYHYEKRNLPGRKDFIEIYCYPQHQQNIDLVMRWLNARYLFYENMLKPGSSITLSAAKAGKTYSVVEIPLRLITDGEYGTDLTLTDTMLVSDADFQPSVKWWEKALAVSGEEKRRDVAVLQYWGQDGTLGGYCDGNIVDGLELYLHTLYKENTLGHNYYEEIKQKLLAEDVDDNERFPVALKGPVVRDVFMTFDVIRSSPQGEQAIKKIMQTIYQVYSRTGIIKPADFAEAVETATERAGLPPEKLAEIHQRLTTISQYSQEQEDGKLDRIVKLNLFLVY